MLRSPLIYTEMVSAHIEISADDISLRSMADTTQSVVHAQVLSRSSVNYASIHAARVFRTNENGKCTEIFLYLATLIFLHFFFFYAQDASIQVSKQVRRKIPFIDLEICCARPCRAPHFFIFVLSVIFFQSGTLWKDVFLVFFLFGALGGYSWYTCSPAKTQRIVSRHSRAQCQRSLSKKGFYSEARNWPPFRRESFMAPLCVIVSRRAYGKKGRGISRNTTLITGPPKSLRTFYTPSIASP